MIARLGLLVGLALTAFVLASVVTGQNALAKGGAGGFLQKREDLARVYCGPATLRHTALLIDLSMLRPNETGWIETVLNSLRFVSNEPLRIFWMKPIDRKMEQLIELCFPGERAKTDAGDELGRTIEAILGAGAGESEIAQTRMRFVEHVQRALLALAGTAVVPGPGVPARLRKEIYETLAVQQGTLTDRPGRPRIVIYSDMLQNSEQLDPEKVEETGTLVEQARQVGRIDLKYGTVQVFGAVPWRPASGSIPATNKIAGFWHEAFRLGRANLVGFDTTLRADGGKESEPAELTRRVWKGFIISEMGGQTYRGPARLDVILNKGGDIQNGWLILPGDHSLPIGGSVRCRNGEPCQFDLQFMRDVGRFIDARMDTIRLVQGEDGPVRGSIQFPAGTMVVSTEARGIMEGSYRLDLRQERADLF